MLSRFENTSVIVTERDSLHPIVRQHNVTYNNYCWL